MNLEFTNIGEMVATQARRYQDRIAIRYYDRDVTYRDLDEQSNRIANGLLRLGVRKGDRGCMLMDNSPEFYYTYLKMLKQAGLDDRHEKYLNILENNLREVLSPFIGNMRSYLQSLS